jgi:hypothetical protein
MDLGLVDLGVSQNAVNWLQGGSEEILAKLLESCASDRSVEVDTLKERIDLDRGLSRG